MNGEDYTQWALPCLMRHVMKGWPRWESSVFPMKMIHVSKCVDISSISTNGTPIPEIIGYIQEELDFAVRRCGLPEELLPLFHEMFRRRKEHLKQSQETPF